MNASSSRSGPGPRPATPPFGMARSRRDRHVAGVAGGLAAHFHIDPTLVRIGFVVLTVLGGSGVAFYLLGWLFLPEEDEDESLAMQLLHHRAGEPWPATALVLAILTLVVVSGALTHPFGMGVLVPVAVATAAVFLLSQRGTGGSSPTTGDPTGGSPAGPAGPAGGSGGPTPWSPPAPPAAPSEPPAPAAPAPDLPSDEDPLLSDPIVTDPLGMAWRDSYESWPAPTVAPPVAALRAPRPGRRITATTVSAIVALGGVVLLIDAIGIAHVGAHGFAAAALIVAGAGLVVSAWAGRAWGLLPVAAALALLVAITGSGSSWRVHPTVGSRHFEPATAAELRPSYHLTAGDLELDLEHVHVDGAPTRVHAGVDAGRVLVTVPADARVAVDARSGAGHIEVFDRADSGPGARLRITDGPEQGGLLVLDLRAGAGAVEVRRAA